MVPWAIWTVGVAAINLMVFIAIRGRWGSVVLLLALAALAGTAAGNALAEALGIAWIVLGEFHVIAASVGAQLAMVVALAAATLLEPVRHTPTRRPRGTPAPPGRDGTGDDR